MSDAISPYHYQLLNGEVETIDLIRDRIGEKGFAAYCEGNVIKYICRWKAKNGVEDLKKAQLYLKWLIEVKEAQREERTWL